MTSQQRIPLVLFLLRISIFLVMFMWTIDKFINPEHAAKVYDLYYFVEFGEGSFWFIGLIELLILFAFVTGLNKKFTYGAVLIFHAVSTLSAYSEYFSPFEGPNLLFFAAWPMLAACYALFALRDLDTRYILNIAKIKAARKS